MKKLSILFILLLIFCLSSYSQTDSTGFFLIKGTVVNGTTNQLLIGSNVLVNQHSGTKTDETGIFSILVKRNDSIKISFVGYKPFNYIIPPKEKGTYLTKFKLYKDSISLTEVEIFSWPSYKEFKKAFLATNKQNEQIKVEGIKLYQDRIVTPPEFHLGHLFTNPISFIYDKMFDKKAKLRRKLDRRRSTIQNSSLIIE